MPRLLLLSLFASIALVPTASPHQQSGSQAAQSALLPAPAAASDAPAQTTTALSLLQQSHQVEEQLPMQARVNLLPRLAQSVSQLNPDLAREWGEELLA